MTSMTEILGEIRCAVCGRRVDSVERELDTAFDRMHITVRCHGAIERSWLDAFEVMDGRVQLGEAFARKALPAPVLELESGRA